MHSRFITSIRELESYLTQKGIKSQVSWFKNGNSLPLRIPYSYADLIDWSDPNDPLACMVLPSDKEQQAQPYELIDPIGDEVHEQVPGLVHRYPDRCLLIFTTYCGVHCRFCFRREYVGKPRPIDMVGCFAYLNNHPEIREVIFTGGDPMTFPQGFLLSVLSKLASIEHIKIVRFHTRLIVMDPLATSKEWMRTLNILGDKQKIIVLHINHPKEITTELTSLVAFMRSQSITVLSQSVLLKGVNDSTDTLKKLFVGLSEIGVLPYYLHHLDFARGTHHFRVSVERGKEMYSALRGRIAGHMIPEYVIDLPGGEGKYPVMWMKEVRNGVYEARSFEGKLIHYKDPISF